MPEQLLVSDVLRISIVFLVSLDFEYVPDLQLIVRVDFRMGIFRILINELESLVISCKRDNFCVEFPVHLIDLTLCFATLASFTDDLRVYSDVLKRLKHLQLFLDLFGRVKVVKIQIFETEVVRNQGIELTTKLLYLVLILVLFQFF